MGIMVTPISKYFTDPENSTRVALREDLLASEVYDWLTKNCKGLYTAKMKDLYLNFYFSDKQDATNFKIFWG